jgi:hypothetical protein
MERLMSDQKPSNDAKPNDVLGDQNSDLDLEGLDEVAGGFSTVTAEPVEPTLDNFDGSSLHK